MQAQSCVEAAAGAPLPGGLCVGSNVFYTGGNKAFLSGNQLEFGRQGVITGVKANGSVLVKFEGNHSELGVTLSRLSLQAPQVQVAGFQKGQKVYYTGSDQQMANGDRLTFGGPGIINGYTSDGRLDVKFEGNRDDIAVIAQGFLVSEVPSLELSAGFRVGQRVFYSGRAQRFDGVDRVTHGASGVIAGYRSERAVVKFDGNRCGVEVELRELSAQAVTTQRWVV